LDASFSGDGRFVGPDNTLATDVLALPDGRLLVLGFTDPAGGAAGDMVVMRLLPDGSPDAGFGAAGSGGRVVIDFGGTRDGAAAFARDAQGRIVAVGAAAPAGGASRVAVARLLEDGALDPSFGVGGKLVLAPRPRSSANDVAIQPDGKIILAGASAASAAATNTDSLLARLLPDGSVDAGFGAGGYVVEDLGPDDALAGVAVDSRGRIAAAALHPSPLFDNGLAVYRYTPGGAPDATFGDAGRALLDRGAAAVGDVLVVQGDALVVSHTSRFSGYGLLKLTESGAPDPTFGDEGFSTLARDTAYAFSDLAPQPDGKLVLAGSVWSDEVPDPRDPGETVRFRSVLVARFDSGGRLDPGFGVDGMVLLTSHSPPEPRVDEDFARAVAVQGDGKIVAAGFGQAPYGARVFRVLGGPPTGAAPATLLPDGTLRVRGTLSPDVIDLETADAPGGPVVRVRFNDLTLDFPADAVSRIDVDGRAGADRFSVRASVDQPVRLAGGEEPADGSSAYDAATLYGTDGPDSAVATASGLVIGTRQVAFDGVELPSVHLLGGNDKAFVAEGGVGVHFFGGDGDDELRATMAYARFDGGAGDDQAILIGNDDRQEMTVYLVQYEFDPGDEFAGSVQSDENGEGGSLVFHRVEMLHLALRGGDDAMQVVGQGRTAVTGDGAAGNDQLYADISGPPARTVFVRDGEIRSGGTWVQYTRFETLSVPAADIIYDVRDPADPLATLTAWAQAGGPRRVEVRHAAAGRTVTVVAEAVETMGAASLVVAPGAAADVRVEGVGGPFAGRVVFSGTDADDTVTLSLGASGAADWQVSGGGSRVTASAAPAGHVAVDGMKGNDTLVLDDAADAGPAEFYLTTGALYAVTDSDLSLTPGAELALYSGFETVVFEGGPGATSVTVQPSLLTRFMVRGNDPGRGDPSGGDSLRLETTGATGMSYAGGEPGNGTYRFDNRQPVEFRGIESVPSVVLASHVFYGRGPTGNNGGFDPEAAIAPDKVPLPAGGGAGAFANVTSYPRGINGLAIDVVRNFLTVHVFLAESLRFKVGAGGDPATWADAPARIALDLRPGHGVNGSDRILLFWRDGAIKNTWLQVTVPASPLTGATSSDVFYFGNLVGETGDRGSPLRVSSTDLANVRRNFSAPGQPVPLTNPYDFNRDGRVNVLDLAVVRATLFHTLKPIRGAVPAAAAAAPALWEDASVDLLGRAV
jgi:uncharacterized delta-60 repeat protein